jgi:ribose transport system substrate-binding protein
MKKESVLLVILVFAFVVVNPSLISIGKMKERAKVGVVFKALDSKWWKTMEGGVYNEVSKYPNIEVVVLAPQAEINVAQQVEIIESLIIQKVDALVIAPCGSEELIPTFEKAKKANIPVIIVDTDTPWKGKECFIGVNNTKGGILGAQYITNRPA